MKFGAPDWNRTNDTSLKRRLLYRLSYKRILEHHTGFEPVLSVWKTDMLTSNINDAYKRLNGSLMSKTPYTLKRRNNALEQTISPSGTPSGARTRDPALKGPWLDLLAHGSILGSFFSYQGDYLLVTVEEVIVMWIVILQNLYRLLVTKTNTFN